MNYSTWGKKVVTKVLKTLLDKVLSVVQTRTCLPIHYRENLLVYFDGLIMQLIEYPSHSSCHLNIWNKQEPLEGLLHQPVFFWVSNL